MVKIEDVPVIYEDITIPQGLTFITFKEFT